MDKCVVFFTCCFAVSLLNSAWCSEFDFPTTTTPALPDRPEPQPPDWEGKYFDIELSLEYNSTIGDNCDNMTSIGEEAQVELLLIYEDSEDLGFHNVTVTDTDFTRPQDSCVPGYNLFPVAQSSPLRSNYTAQYSMEFVLTTNNSINLIIDFIEYDAMEELKNTSIGGREVNDTYIDEEVVDKQLKLEGEKLKEFAQYPCDNGLTCDYGYYCDNNPQSEYDYCTPICYNIDSQTCCYETKVMEFCVATETTECHITGQDVGDFVCNCRNGYTEFSGSCSKRSVIIGSFTAIVLAVLLALFALVIVLVFRLTNHKGHTSNGSPANGPEAPKDIPLHPYKPPTEFDDLNSANPHRRDMRYQPNIHKSPRGEGRTYTPLTGPDVYLNPVTQPGMPDDYLNPVSQPGYGVVNEGYKDYRSLQDLSQSNFYDYVRDISDGYLEPQSPTDRDSPESIYDDIDAHVYEPAPEPEPDYEVPLQREGSYLRPKNSHAPSTSYS